MGTLALGGDLSCRPDEPANVKGSPAACGAGGRTPLRISVPPFFFSGFFLFLCYAYCIKFEVNTIEEIIF